MSTSLLVILIAIGVAFLDFLLYAFVKSARKFSLFFARVILGCVFIFSGFVKAVDPLGSMYKFHDYFLAFGMEWMIPAALMLGFLLFILEFILGFAFLFNLRLKSLSWLMLLFMTFFFILTFILAIKNPVSDCGCFGDALILTNWETFFKNISLMIFALMIFSARKKLDNRFPLITQNGMIFVGLLIVLSISVYSYRYLPIIDFMHWKIGNNISKEVMDKPEIADIMLVYKNKETGEKLEYTSKTLPWKDSVFFKKLEFVEQKKAIIQEYQPAPVHDFMLDDENGVNHINEIVGNPGFQFILVSYDLGKTSLKGFEKISDFNNECSKDSVGFVTLCGSDWETIHKFKINQNIEYPFYVVDATALKSVVRSNPGLVLLKNGVVVDKWSWRCFPKYEDLKNKMAEYTQFADKIINSNKDKK